MLRGREQDMAGAFLETCEMYTASLITRNQNLLQFIEIAREITVEHAK